MNLACSLMAYGLWKSTTSAAPQRGHQAPAGDTTPVPKAPMAAMFASGAPGMICQVSWTRAFALLLGSSTYAFTIVLATFLLGLAAGTEGFHVLRRRWKPELFGLGLLLAAIGWSVLDGIALFNWLPYAQIRI